MLKPDATYPLSLVYNRRGKSEASKKQLLIDTTALPESPGAYVVRYLSYEIPRLIGKSAILKIGSASISVRDRFDNYNHQKDVTTEGADLFSLLANRSQKTNVRLMHFLAHHKHPSDLVIDVYINAPAKESAEAIEATLLRRYLEEHGELPPLNYGTR